MTLVAKEQNLLLDNKNLLQRNKNLLLSQQEPVTKQKELVAKQQEPITKEKELIAKEQEPIAKGKGTCWRRRSTFFVRNENRLERNRYVRLGGAIGYVGRLVGICATFFFFGVFWLPYGRLSI